MRILIVRLRQPNGQRIHNRVLLALGRFPDERQWQDKIVVMRDHTQSVWRRRTKP